MFDIDQEVKEAKKRINASIDKLVEKTLREVLKEKQYRSELKLMCETAILEMIEAKEREKSICHSMIGWVTIKLN